MANPLRLTKGEAVAGKLISNDEVVVGADLEVADDAYVTGAFGKGVAVTNITDGASMTFTAANLLSGIVTATPTRGSQSYKRQLRHLLLTPLMLKLKQD
jgi:hypothetical protein